MNLINSKKNQYQNANPKISIESRIIDFHVHCFPDEIAVKAIPALSLRANIEPELNGTVKAIQDSMKNADISISVIQSIATKPTQTERINNWAISIQSADIFAFGSIHPMYREWKNELKRIKNAGIRGIKLHPDYQDFMVDDSNMYPIYEYAAELGLIILFHSGVDIGLPGPVHCTPERLRRVIDDINGVKIIAAHTGGYNCWDEVERYLVGAEVYFDTSFTLGWIEETQFNRILNNHNPEKLLFGTDSPWTDQAEEINKLCSLNLKNDMLNAILGANAAKLLSIC